ncbi:MAG: heat-inducible transcriptional repressor HrcA [Candidatus Dormiibacterota bacterium]
MGAARYTAMESSIPLDSRKEQILKAVVSDYTATGVPVGSHALALHLASWSAATIRNELSTLVEVGYLLQPHTSAGRVPSDRGYRYYVDFLMEEEALPGAVRRQLEPRLAAMPQDLEGVLEMAAQVLSTAVDALSIVTGPQSRSAAIKHLDLVSLDPAHALLVLVLEGNLVRQHALVLSWETGQEELSTLARRLNVELAGLEADQVATRADAGPADPLHAEVVSEIAEFLHSFESRQDALIVHDGVRNLLRQPEFGDVQRLGQVLEIIEQDRILGELLLAAFDPGRPVTVMIGTESGIAQLSSCSLVLTTYRAGPSRGGTVGVLGPTRMPYAQVAPRVRYVAERVGAAVSRVLS